MDTKTKNKDFLQIVYSDLMSVLEEYKVVLPNPDEDQAFREDLITTVSDRIKGSFKNGISVGMRRKASQESK